MEEEYSSRDNSQGGGGDSVQISDRERDSESLVNVRVASQLLDFSNFRVFGSLKESKTSVSG